MELDPQIQSIVKSMMSVISKRPDTIRLPKDKYDAYQQFVKNAVGDKSKAWFLGYGVTVEYSDTDHIEYLKNGVLI